MDLFNKLSQWIKVKITSENNDTNNYLEYKILVLGDKSVGKSSICNRFCLNEFSLEIKPSVNCECFVKTVRLFDQYIKLFIIDTVEAILSNDRYELYSDVKGAIIMYDLTKTSTFDKLDKWLLDVKQRINPQLPILVVGHKKDLTFLRNVDYEEGKEKSIKNSCSFLETTCIDEDSVDIAFKTLVAKIYFNDMPETKKQYFRMAIKDEIKEEPEEKERSLSINSQKVQDIKESKP